MQGAPDVVSFHGARHQALWIDDGDDRLVGKHAIHDCAATGATPRLVDAEVADQRDDPAHDRSALGGILFCVTADDDERVVDDVLRTGPVAQDAESDGQESRRVPVIQETDRISVASLDALEQLDIRSVGGVPR